MIKEYAEYIKLSENLFNELFNKTADIVVCDSYFEDEEIMEKEWSILRNLIHQDKFMLSILISKCIDSTKNIANCCYTYNDDGNVILAFEETDLKGDTIIAHLTRYILLSDVINDNKYFLRGDKSSFLFADKQLENMASFIKSSFEYTKTTISSYSNGFFQFKNFTNEDVTLLYYLCESIKRLINLSKKNDNWKMWEDVKNLTDEDYKNKYTISKELFKHINTIRNDLEQEVISRCKEDYQREAIKKES